MKLRVLFLSIFLLIFSTVQIQGNSQEVKWKSTIEVEDGVRVIKNPKEPLYGEITFELEEDLVIGNEIDENFIFNKIIYPGIDSSGNIFVVDTGNHRVQKFDVDGNFISSFGRRGQGPGEFNYPIGIRFDKESMIYVIGNFKLHLFDKNGRFSKSVRLSKQLIDLAVTSNKPFIAYFKSVSNLNGKMQMMDYLELVGPEGKTIKNIASYTDKTPSLGQGLSGKSVNVGDSYAPRFVFCPIGNGFSIHGFPSEYKLSILNPSGNCILIIRKQADTVSIASKEKKESIKTYTENQKRTRIKTKIEDKFPRNKPYYDQILCGSNNQIFVRKASRYEEAQRDVIYDLFNSEGLYLYEVMFSQYPQEIFDIKNKYVYSKMTDQETGYARIIRFRIKNWEQIREGR